jgi:hypothetical protein
MWGQPPSAVRRAKPGWVLLTGRAVRKNMARSVHDNLLISYEVQCEARTITLRTEYRESDRPTKFTNVIFEGVEGYSLQNDAFGNIIFDVESVSVDALLTQFGAEITESHRMGGSPGPWAANLDSAKGYLSERGIRGFLLSSSYGLSGWVLAREMSLLSGERGISAGQSHADLLSPEPDDS